MTVEREWFAAAKADRAAAPDYLDFLSFEMVAIAVVIVAGAMLAFHLLRSRVRPKPLMTRVEREVLGHLEAAAPWCRVHAQVCLGALLQSSKWLPGGTRARARYAYTPARSSTSCSRTGGPAKWSPLSSWTTASITSAATPSAIG
jgi:hypothetical protein